MTRTTDTFIAKWKKLIFLGESVVRMNISIREKFALNLLYILEKVIAINVFFIN